MTIEDQCEEIINGLRDKVSAGQLALEALEAYLVHELPPPQWVLESIADCYERFKHTRSSSGWVNDQGAVPRTLGEAFEIPDHAVVHLRTRRLRKEYTARVEHAFVALGTPRTPKGYKEVAEALGITEKQVRTLLPKTRANVKGHKPFGLRSPTAASANDPFSLAGRKKPKK